MIKLNLWDIIQAREPVEKPVRESLADRKPEDDHTERNEDRVRKDQDRADKPD